MKVLYLVSARGWPRRITPYSFLDEEIHALAARGVRPYILTHELARDDQRDGIRMLAVPRGRWGDRVRTLPFLVASRRDLPPDALKDLRHTFHAARLERHAAEAIRRHDIDLMHTHFAAYGLGGVLARAATGTPLVATFRGMDLLMDPSIQYGARQDPFYDRTVRTLLRRVDVTTYVSDFMREAGVRMGAAPETARTIRKGVDLARFATLEDRAEVKEALGLEGPVVLSVGVLIPRKGMDTVIEALARSRATPPPTLVICGDGDHRDRLVELSRTLGVEDRVRFRGWVERDRIPLYFAACDLFVLASRIEAAGNVILEAMASGRPVLTTASGGPPEFVRDGETGFVVEPGDPAALAERMDRLLGDESLRARMGRAGRRAVEASHPYDSMIDAYLEVYREALDGARGHGRHA